MHFSCNMQQLIQNLTLYSFILNLYNRISSGSLFLYIKVSKIGLGKNFIVVSCSFVDIQISQGVLLHDS